MSDYVNPIGAGDIPAPASAISRPRLRVGARVIPGQERRAGVAGARSQR